MPGIEPNLTVCKSSTVPAVLSFQPVGSPLPGLSAMQSTRATPSYFGGREVPGWGIGLSLPGMSHLLKPHSGVLNMSHCIWGGKGVFCVL